MVEVKCENRACRLRSRSGECTARGLQIVFDDEGGLQVDCPEITVKQD